MEQQADFVIENGILIEYHGSGGDIVIPAGNGNAAAKSLLLHYQ